MKKKGEMTTQQIVTLVILIASFIVILFFILRLNLGEETEKDVCHNSVITRGSSIVPAASVPLDCKRTYVCITKDGTCENMTTKNEIKVKDKKEIFIALANELSDCWWMYGEGKINYAEDESFSKLHCSVCSQIAFDDSVKDIIPSGNLSKKEFYQFLALENKTEGETYSMYLFGTNDFAKNYPGEFGNISLDEQYYVLTGITSDVSTLSWIAIGAGLGIAVLATGGLAALTFGGIAVAGGSGAVVGGLLLTPAAEKVGGIDGDFSFVAPIIKGETGNEYIIPSLVEADSEEFNSLNCKRLDSKG